jgi:hypothetical protein
VLVEVLNVLPLLPQLLLDCQKSMYFVSIVLSISHISVSIEIIDVFGIVICGLVDVLGLLFLADVELFRCGLALGEGVTVGLLASVYYMLQMKHKPSSRASRPRRTRAGRALSKAAGSYREVAGCGDRARALDDGSSKHCKYCV